MARHATALLALIAVSACGTNVDLGGGGDAAKLHDSGPPACLGAAPPDASAKCIGCKVGHVSPCQANGCFDGYYCELSRLDCQPMKEACEPEAGKRD
jgi:hypothetical protein